MPPMTHGHASATPRQHTTFHRDARYDAEDMRSAAALISPTAEKMRRSSLAAQTQQQMQQTSTARLRTQCQPPRSYNDMLSAE